MYFNFRYKNTTKSDEITHNILNKVDWVKHRTDIGNFGI
jgi:hypothetical protein